MTMSNTRATTIMHEIQQGNYLHMAELQEVCDKQLSLVIYRKSYEFFADWGEEEVIAHDSCQRIHKELDRLPTNHRRAIKLCRIEDYKLAKAAKMMNCKSADISRWINRGLNKIERFVERE